MKQFSHLLKQTKIKSLSLLFISLALSVGVAILRILAGYLYDPLVSAATNPPYQFNWQLCVWVIALNILLAIGIGLTQRVKVKSNLYLEGQMTGYFISHLEQTDGLAIDKSGMGPWLTLLMDDIKECSYFLSTTLFEIVIGLASFLLAVVYGMRTNWQLTLGILCVSFIGGLLMKGIGPRLQAAKEDEQAAEEDLQPLMVQILSQIPLIRAHRAEHYTEELFEEYHAHYRKQQYQRQRHRALLESLSIGLGFVMTTSWISLAFILMVRGELTLGQLFSFMIIDRYFTWVFFNLPSLYSEYLMAKVCAERVMSFKKEHYSQPEVGEIHQASVLSLVDLGFAYSDHPVLEHLTAKFEKGTQYALMGASGSGKSTVLKLLAGIYPSYSGTIELDGQSVASDRLSAVVSYLPQDNVVIEDTIRENILLGRQLSDADLNHIIELSGLTSLLERLDDGLDTLVISGANQNLSEGEIQRIGFARALVKEASFLLLDEPTASLDVELEQVLVDYYQKTDQGVIVATHRDTSLPSDFVRIPVN